MYKYILLLKLEKLCERLNNMAHIRNRRYILHFIGGNAIGVRYKFFNIVHYS